MASMGEAGSSATFPRRRFQVRTGSARLRQVFGLQAFPVPGAFYWPPLPNPVEVSASREAFVCLPAAGQFRIHTGFPVPRRPKPAYQQHSWISTGNTHPTATVRKWLYMLFVNSFYATAPAAGKLAGCRRSTLRVAVREYRFVFG